VNFRKKVVLVKIKVVHLTSVHQPFDTRVFYKECKTLVKAGYDVALIAPCEQDELIDGVKIRAVPTPKSRLKRITSTTWQAYKAALNEDAHIYHLHDPELILAGLLLKFHGKRVIRDVHEDLPRQIFNKHWIPQRLRGLIGQIANIVETISALGFDLIIVATPKIAKRFPKKRTVIVQNFPIIDEVVNSGGLPYSAREPLMAYAGGISVIRGAREMVAAMALLPKSFKARLVLAGIFDPLDLEADISKIQGWEKVEFLGWQTRDGIRDLLSKAMLGLVLFHPAPNHKEAQPNKLFEYMSAGIPVIASDFPLWREIIEEVGCGLLVDPLDPQAIADAIQFLLEHPEEAEAMGKRGYKAVCTLYNWDTEARKMLEFYEKITRR